MRSAIPRKCFPGANIGREFVPRLVDVVSIVSCGKAESPVNNDNSSCGLLVVLIFVGFAFFTGQRGPNRYSVAGHVYRPKRAAN